MIVEGTVESYRFDEQAHMTFVHFLVSVDEVIKGGPLQQIEVTLPGGPRQEGGYIRVGGAPYLLPGERVLLLGAEWGDSSTYRLVSWTEGVLRERDGMAFLGSGVTPLTTLACDASAVSVRGAEESSADDLSQSVPEEDEAVDAAPLVASEVTWDDAVTVVRSCVSEVTR